MILSFREENEPVAPQVASPPPIPAPPPGFSLIQVRIARKFGAKRAAMLSRRGACGASAQSTIGRRMTKDGTGGYFAEHRGIRFHVRRLRLGAWQARIPAGGWSAWFMSRGGAIAGAEARIDRLAGAAAAARE